MNLSFSNCRWQDGGWVINIKFAEPFSKQSPENEYLSSCLFSVTAIINYHKLCDLKQYKFIILQFHRWENPKGFLAKIKVLAGLYSTVDALGKNPFPCLFQPLEATHIPWLRVPFLHLQNQQGWVTPFSYCHLKGLQSSCPSSTFEDPCDYIGPLERTQDNLLILKSDDKQHEFHLIL